MKAFIKEIRLYRREGIVISSIIFIGLFLIQYFVLHKMHVWVRKEIDISNPLVSKIVVFLLTFCVLGALLYRLKFYKVLHDIVVKIFGNWELYKFIKRLVWIGLSRVTSSYVVPCLNLLMSFLYNLGLTILYLLPSVLFSLLVTLGIMYLYLRLKKK